MEANATGDASQAAAQPKRVTLKRRLRTVDKKRWFHQLTQQVPDLTPLAYISKFNAQFPNPLAS